MSYNDEHTFIQKIPVFSQIPPHKSLNIDAILQQIVKAANNVLSRSPKRILTGHSIIDDSGWDLTCKAEYQYLPVDNTTTIDEYALNVLDIFLSDLYSECGIDEGDGIDEINDEDIIDYLKEQIFPLSNEVTNIMQQAAIAYYCASWARKNDINALHILANLYIDDESFLDKDPDAAYELYNLSARGGHLGSQVAISNLIRSSIIIQSVTIADYWDSRIRERCEEIGDHDPICLKILSEFHDSGRGGLSKDKSKSQDLLYKLYCMSTDPIQKESIKHKLRSNADLGDGRAHYLIACILKNDFGYSADHYEVYIELLHASEAGDEDAKQWLGERGTS